MDFEFSKDEKLLQSAVREFFEKECSPSRIREIEESEKAMIRNFGEKWHNSDILVSYFQRNITGRKGPFSKR